MSFHIFFIFAFIIVLNLLVQLWLNRNCLQNARKQLRNEYGEFPETLPLDSEDYVAISRLFSNLKHEIPEDELIDEITWNDLDMDDIFQRVNCTNSFIGEQTLFNELHRIPKEKEHLHLREKLIQFFENNPKEREDTQLVLQRLKKSSVNYYIVEFMDNLELQIDSFFKLCKILQCTLILFLSGAILSQSTILIAATLIHFLVNLTLYALSKTKYEVMFESLYGVIRTLKTADILNNSPIADIINEKDNYKKLSKINTRLVALERKKQAGIAGDINGIIYDYFIGALLWDFTVYDRVIHLLLKNKESFLHLYHFIGEVDLSITIGSFRQCLDHYCIPAFSEKNLTATDIYHPLVDNAVTNDFPLTKNVIITGSNASGKSTFIKAIAVNLILGQSINTCTATDMTIPNVIVLTSMAVRDDVRSGESYYIKEVKYLKRMIEYSNHSRMVFCGIDEILRGTNTSERVAASISILEYLFTKNCMLMVASHDLELAHSLDGRYENFYFCESIEGKDVVFDYKLCTGISHTNNAIRLLESMGFPEEIVLEAKRRKFIENKLHT